MKNPTVLFLTPARSFQCELYATPTFRRDQQTESATKEFAEKYHPLRQRTVREETTKDKAGALPPAVYTNKQDSTKVDLLTGLGNDFNAGDQPE